MKCANHPDTDAVGICQGCGSALCPECRAGDDFLICAPCLVRHNKRVMRQFGIEVAISASLLFFAATFLIGTPMSASHKVLFSLMAAFLPFGWSALSRYFSAGSEFTNPMVRLTAFSAHFIGAALLGIVVGPPRIFKAVREILVARKANAAVKSG